MTSTKLYALANGSNQGHNCPDVWHVAGEIARDQPRKH